MKTQFPVLLFDFEGTLVDFQWKLKDAARDVKNELRLLGFDPSAWEDNYATLRNQATQFAAQIGLDKRAVIKRLDPIYDQYDQDAATRWAVLPKVKMVLARLKHELQIQIGLTSNIGRRALDEATPRLGLTGFFDVIITRNDVEALKPSGEGVRSALKKLGAKNSDALFVGDSVTDVLAAKDAGVQAAIIQGGESASVALVAAEPSYLWNAIDEIETLYDGGKQTN